MREQPKGAGRLAREDLLMVLLCCLTSFWLLASPLVQYTFTIDTVSGFAGFFVATVLLGGALSIVGVTLNHMTARNAHVRIGRGRRR